MTIITNLLFAIRSWIKGTVHRDDSLISHELSGIESVLFQILLELKIFLLERIRPYVGDTEECNHSS